MIIAQPDPRSVLATDIIGLHSAIAPTFPLVHHGSSDNATSQRTTAIGLVSYNSGNWLSPASSNVAGWKIQRNPLDNWWMLHDFTLLCGLPEGMSSPV